MPQPVEPVVPSRVVVAGLPSTVGPAVAAFEAVRGGPLCVGVALVGEGDFFGRRDLPVRRLEAAADLARLGGEIDFDGVLVCLPAAMGVLAAGLEAAAERLGVAFRTHPPLSDSLSGASVSASGDLSGTDLARLVGRSPRQVDRELAARTLTGRRVLITGAGGSIGSELARLAASFGPESLLLVERSENALFEIDREIAARHPGVRRRAILHDVVDEDATLQRFAALRPEVIFHAAAHKHVPMMEDHPSHAVDNNVFGTKSVADAALTLGVDSFILVSTDKAVNPTSVMGATKRFAEMYVRSLNGRGGTRFSMVRFGNVLGSSGSVLTVWRRQIAAGGPLTITDPAMTRYFMTIPEAASLVAQAGALTEDEADGADVFVLDMGQPIRIVDLAERYLRRLGLAPRWPEEPPPRDGEPPAPGVRIEYTGARPGEKIHEELAHAAERLRPTPVGGVLAWAGARADRLEISKMMAELAVVRRTPDPGAAAATIHHLLGETDRGVQLESRRHVAGAA